MMPAGLFFLDHDLIGGGATDCHRTSRHQPKDVGPLRPIANHQVCQHKMPEKWRILVVIVKKTCFTGTESTLNPWKPITFLHCTKSTVILDWYCFILQHYPEKRSQGGQDRQEMMASTHSDPRFVHREERGCGPVRFGVPLVGFPKWRPGRQRTRGIRELTG